jgi:hypothetical protein
MVYALQKIYPSVTGKRLVIVIGGFTRLDSKCLGRIVLTI